MHELASISQKLDVCMHVNFIIHTYIHALYIYIHIGTGTDSDTRKHTYSFAHNTHTYTIQHNTHTHECMCVYTFPLQSSIFLAMYEL